MAAKPIQVEWKPRWMLSAPRLGPTVRSSTISTGAANAPARSSSDSSLASLTLSRPSIWKAFSELLADDRRGDDLFHASAHAQRPPLLVQHRPALFVESRLRLDFDVHHGHAFADVLTGDALVDGRTAGIERDGNDRAGALAVEPRRRVHDIVAGVNQPVLEQDRLAVAHLVELGAGRYLARERARDVALLVHQHDLERRRASNNTFSLGGVLHTGQLHHNAVLTLLLDHRLGHAEFVHTIIERGDVLFERKAPLLLSAASLSRAVTMNSPPRALSSYTRSRSSLRNA